MAMKSQIVKVKNQHTLILFGENSSENGNGHIWLITQGEDKPQITEITDHEKINRMTMIYWD